MSKKPIKLVGVFSRCSQTLRELGYRVETDPDKGTIKAYKRWKCVFEGTRREAWKWMQDTKQIKALWNVK